jgi:hypothetical protein
MKTYWVSNLVGGRFQDVVSGQKDLVRFAHNQSRASRSCDWNVGILEWWNNGCWENGVMEY